MKIGVLSDTHLYAEDVISNSPFYQLLVKICNDEFQGVQYIIHAGDVVDSQVIQILQKIAPVVVVKGNCDESSSSYGWPSLLRLEFEQVRIVVAHNRLSLYPLAAEQPHVFIFGHSHIAYLEQSDDGSLWLNPGSLKRPAGPDHVRSVAILTVQNGKATAELKKY
jgi:uncharacterized protein